jgi:predicted dithiol-disulfide oxidoreductase (DUF899 family)
LTDHAVVSHDEWLAARSELLAAEKEFTRRRDAMTAQQRALPWEAVEKEYVFEGAGGPVSLAGLFAGKSQLVVYHFMFDPEDDVGCKSCSFWADSFDPNVVHLAARDVTLAAISRAPFAKLDAYRRRMGWSFTWVSARESDFNHDFGVSFAEDERDRPVYNVGTLPPRIADREGMSVFFKDGDGRIYHTYSTYARGIDTLNAAYQYLDLVPKGRDEDAGHPQAWVRRHDEY